jgi:hypothetical protein
LTEGSLIMKSTIAIALLVLTAACNATRAPADEDGIDADRVNPAWRTPSGAGQNQAAPCPVPRWHAPDPYEQ